MNDGYASSSSNMNASWRSLWSIVISFYFHLVTKIFKFHIEVFEPTRTWKKNMSRKVRICSNPFQVLWIKRLHGMWTYLWYEILNKLYAKLTICTVGQVYFIWNLAIVISKFVINMILPMLHTCKFHLSLIWVTNWQCYKWQDLWNTNFESNSFVPNDIYN
jgi:hypothetical protein